MILDNPSKVDRRILQTKRKLHRAITDLVIERGFSNISIRDITNYSGIGYATFFRHYKDKESLLLDVLIQLVDEIQSVVGLGTSPDPERNGKIIFEHVEKNSRLYQVLLETPGRDSILEKLYKSIIEDILQNAEPIIGGTVPPAVAAYHITQSSISLIKWWLQSGKPYSPEEMGKIYSELIIRPVHQVSLKLFL